MYVCVWMRFSLFVWRHTGLFSLWLVGMGHLQLVSGISLSDDMEAYVISKLKTVCGFEYTAKLQRMFQVIYVYVCMYVCS